MKILKILQRLQPAQKEEWFPFNPSARIDSYWDNIYRIDPVYQPEPEVVKCEREPDSSKGEMVFFYGNRWRGLEIADTFKDFIEWQDKDGNVMPYYRMPSKIKGRPAEIAKYVVFAKGL